MNKLIFDVIIVGQGLAGSILSWQLKAQGLSCLVINNQPELSASRAAAGILNPITGKRLVKAPLTNTYLSKAQAFYKSLEEDLQASFFEKRSFIRLLKSKEEASTLQERVQDPKFKAFIPQIYPSFHFEYLNDPYGSFAIDSVYTLNTNLFLDLTQNYLQQNQSYLEDLFIVEDLTVSSDAIFFKNYKSTYIIFCEGAKATNNPFFSYLPFAPAKGEILELDLLKSIPNIIVNQEKWIVPTGKTRVKIGSTYTWDDLNNNPTAKAKGELLSALHTLLKGSFVPLLISHKAAIRPCSKDASPFIGFHPKHSNVGIFNGFGSKGSLCIPFFAELFVDSIKSKKALDPFIDIHRYNHLLDNVSYSPTRK